MRGMHVVRQHGLVAVSVATAVTLAGCAADTADSAEGTAADDVPAVLAGMCRAQAEPAQAREAFDNAHQRLHQLASQAEDVDRAVAGELLESKRAVEAALAESSDSSRSLEEPLEGLVDAVRDALRTTGQPAPRCHTLPEG